MGPLLQNIFSFQSSLMSDSNVSLNEISWTLWMMASVTGTIITGLILWRETRKRDDDACTFGSNALRITSIVCMWSGLGVNICLIIWVLPGFCLMDSIPGAITFAMQFISLGFYQLSRLHYCFSRDRVYSHKGYPFWAFIVMIVAAILMIFWWLFNVIIVEPFTLKCGFSTSSGSFFHLKKQSHSILFNGMYRDFVLSLIVCAQIWDITTLMMYIYKIWKIGTFFKSQSNDIWNNILSVLQRIVTVTLLYQLTMLLNAVLFYFVPMIPGLKTDDNIAYTLRWCVMPSISSISWSLSMYLMMEHNLNEYIQFLYFCRTLHLDFVCFCCRRHIVDRQLKELKKSVKEPRIADPTRKLPTAQSDVTVFTNADENYKIPNPRNSVETVTVINMNEDYLDGVLNKP